MAGHREQVVGYVRVGAADQNQARQLEALGSVDRLFGEKVRGKNTNNRAQLQEMLIYVGDGDTVRMKLKSPDRLAVHSTAHRPRYAHSRRSQTHSPLPKLTHGWVRRA